MAEPRPIDVEEAARSEPRGSLSIRTLAMPADTNQYGDIFGGWLLGQMDIAGGILAATIAKGRTATIAVDGMTFRKPVYVGDVVAFCLHSKDVLISAGHDVDRTTHQSVKRFASAFKVGNGDIESIFLEMTATLGQSKRQIIEM